MTRVVPLVVIACGLCACELSVNTGTGVSARVGATSPAEPSPLPGWTLEGHAKQAYAAEVDTEVVRDGRATIRLHPTAETGGEYATFMTSLDATPFRGRRAHGIVWIRTQGVTARGDVWMRAQAADSPPDGPGMAMSIVRLAPNADFTRYELYVDVPDDAVRLQLGLGLGGPGMLWMDSVRIEAQ